MSAPSGGSPEPIENKSQLVAYMEAGCKPERSWRIGTEHEKFAFHKADGRRPAYAGQSGIRAILDGLAEQFDWQRLYEGELPIALNKDGCNITLEPGGQFELSGAPLETLHQTCCEVHTHLDQVRKVCDPLELGMLGMGFDPKWRREDVSWMPKGRYKIMGDYMPKVGSLGLDMMLRTCTIQVNLDFHSEADMVEKFRVGLALQPVATALFANSPFTEGKPNGFLSYRSHIWTDTDPDRCGILPFVFEDGMGFERYVDHVLDVPMYFIYRDGDYLDCSGQSFRDFMAGKLPALPGEKPTMGDWADHLTTLFPEVRLKRFLEMRGADGGPWKQLCALPALWVGLLYDAVAQDEAAQLIKGWRAEDHARLRQEAPRRGLAAEIGSRTLQDVARDMLAIARGGLKRRACMSWDGRDETTYLAALDQIVATGRTPAHDKLARYAAGWQHNIDAIYREDAY